MFKKASSYKNDKLSIVVFGEPNAGKTTLITTIKEKALIIDAERGLQSINDSEIDVFQLFENSEGAEIPRYQRFDRLVKIIDHLKSGKDENKFKWIVIDSITEVSQNLIEQCKLEEDIRVKNGDKPNKFRPWGDYNDRITALLKDLRDMKGFNVVLNALVDKQKNDDGPSETKVDMQGKISDRLPAIFDEVFYLDKDKEGVRRLVTDDYKNILCKDRSGKLNKFEAADLDAISKKIRGGNKKNVTKKNDTN